MKLDDVLRIFKHSGGYPNPKALDILDILNLTKIKFAQMVADRFGESGANKFFDTSVKRLSQKDGVFKIYPYAQWGEDNPSYLDLDFSNSNTLLEEVGNPYIGILIEDWKLKDSLVEFTDDEGNTRTYTLEELFEVISDEDPFQLDDAIQEWMYMMQKSISDYLGVRVVLGDRKK